MNYTVAVSCISSVATVHVKMDILVWVLLKNSNPMAMNILTYRELVCDEFIFSSLTRVDHIGGPGGGGRDVPPSRGPNTFIFMQLLAKIIG